MSTNTNGIATCTNLYSLNSSAFPNWNGVLKCPTKAEITEAINSNYTLTIANTNNYGNNQLVKYSDISIAENGYRVYLNISVTFFPRDADDISRSAELIVTKTGSPLATQFIECTNANENTTKKFKSVLTLIKNTSYDFILKEINGSPVGTYSIGGITGSFVTKNTGIPHWPDGETPNGTIEIS